MTDSPLLETMNLYSTKFLAFRRLFNKSQFLLRRRLWSVIIILWFLVIIFLTFKLMNNESASSSLSPKQTSYKFYSDLITSKTSYLYDDEALEEQDNGIEEENIGRDTKRTVITSKTQNDNHHDDVNPDPNNHNPKNNNEKSEIDNYVRQTKVFILLVEEEEREFHAYDSRYNNNNDNGDGSSPFTNRRDRRRRLTPDLESDLPNPDWNINLPTHISLVIEILESHRIAYTLGSTRNGLPSSLLIDDQREPASNDEPLHPQYSVIIVDDFIKYTKLSRWLRDQLDRHCRKNSIGMVTYLVQENHEFTSRSAVNNKNEGIVKPTQTNLNLWSKYSSPYPSASGSNLATPRDKDKIESLTDQFPLSFKPIHQNTCLANNKNRTAASSCLKDYQLDDRSPVLRILKRRPNFILPGPLIRNVNRSPWFSISSNHITYQPLTWAHSISAKSTQFVRAGRSASTSKLSTQSSNRLIKDENHADPFKHRYPRASLVGHAGDPSANDELVKNINNNNNNNSGESFTANNGLDLTNNNNTQNDSSASSIPSTIEISGSLAGGFREQRDQAPRRNNVIIDERTNRIGNLSSSSSLSSFVGVEVGVEETSNPIERDEINSIDSLTNETSIFHENPPPIQQESGLDYNDQLDRISDPNDHRPRESNPAADPNHVIASDGEFDSYGDAHDDNDNDNQQPANDNVNVGDNDGESASSLSLDDSDHVHVLSMYDRGLYDGIKRVIFGGANHHWLNRILLLDSIEHLSSGTILSPMVRYVQIDIDDIFVGAQGTKMNASDVDALLESQLELNKLISGFKYNLGYSGRFFQRGLESEKEGDSRLIEMAHNFTWFCHTWSHSKAHLANSSESIELELRRNLAFARSKGLPIVDDRIGDSEGGGRSELKRRQRPVAYAVAPHHSGVYPIHELLYGAWRRVLNVQVTSTEEYPHLRPASGRRGFVHKSIKVLPRQTCGLYTHTIYKSRYPGGFQRLVASIEGGELFQTMLHNPVNIYMSHQSNYARDRLAPLAFERLFKFLDEHTNLQLRYATGSRGGAPALELADYYFEHLFPRERQEPLWTNPCSDPRHLAIWAPRKRRLCPLTPSLLIVGPQKSGTSALLEFLKLSGRVRAKRSSGRQFDFEEIQFFNKKHYWRGVDWYLERFSLGEEDAGRNATHGTPARAPPGGGQLKRAARRLVLVDKSATYFDDSQVPQRAHALLPHARIIIMLINPADRAYSWYQHQRAHSDPVASNHSFEEIITSAPHEFAPDGRGARSSRPRRESAELRQLRSRCLEPGFYSTHLSRWLDFYPSRQIIIIDGHWFRGNPAAVMNKLQRLLKLDANESEPVDSMATDYHKLLVYHPRKGFFCARNHLKAEQPVCLGPGKGRRYSAMSADARLHLNRLYYAHNRQLARILNDIGQPLPAWLLEAIGSSSSRAAYVTK